MTDREKLLQAALAGLLHDLGKLEQRARVDPWNFPEDARDIAPVHAAWTLSTVEKDVPKPYRRFAMAGAYHHHPDSAPGEFSGMALRVALADKLSSGERSDAEAEQPGKKFVPQLVSIFDQLTLDKARTRAASHYLPLRELKLEKQVIFPLDQAWKPDELGKAYDTLCSTLETELKRDPGSLEAYLEGALAALQRLAWCVPSAFYYSEPDVSLYDHARMTAALAACLVEVPDERVRALHAAVKEHFSDPSKAAAILEEPLVALVGGDISGIQQFLYTISSSEAAKTLRGRSLYLQLLTEAVLRFTLRELGLPYTNVIYSGGGHFYLLAPLSAADRLPEIQRQVTRKLLRHHGSALYLALGCAAVPASGFQLGKFPDYWGRMHANLAQAKQRRYVELGEELYDLVFAPQPHGGNREHLCSVCGLEREDLAFIDDEGPHTPDDPKWCSLCASFGQELGKNLPGSGYLALLLGAPRESQPGSALDVLAEFGLRPLLLEDAHQPLPPAAGGWRPERAVVWLLDDPDGALDWGAGAAYPVTQTLRYTLNRVPRDEKGAPRTFDELSEEAQGIPRLGVLRMDLDSAGDLFQRGLGEKASLARLSALSFHLSLFFEGWLKRLCEENPSTYSVYSGGDDLFLIAPWHGVPELARRVRRALGEFAGGSPDLHISGGMTFIHGKYPIYQAAEDAGRALDKAKQVDGKDAFTFLDQPWKWDKFAELQKVQERLVELCDKEGEYKIPESLLQLFRRLQQMCADAKENGRKDIYGPWTWMFDYRLTRMIENAPEKGKTKLTEIRDELKPFYIDKKVELWSAAARWAQLWLRKTPKSKDESENSSSNS